MCADTASGIPLATIVASLTPPALRIEGPADRAICRAAPISDAAAGDITFCWKTGESALRLMRETAATTILCGDVDGLAQLAEAGKTLVVVRDPRLSFLRVVRTFFEPPPPAGIHPTAVIERDATVAPSAYIGPFTYIGADCSVGEGSVIYGHVHVYPKTSIGRNVTIHAGTVIGSDGYGYQRNEAGELEKFPHIGGVVIEDDVEIGSNTSIDRGTLGNTVIRQGARIDNQVHVAHNVVVGRHAAVIANAMIGGSTTIGDGAWIAPSACLRDGLTIGANAVIGLGALVVKNVPDGATVMGAPARDAASYRKLLEAFAGFIDR